MQLEVEQDQAGSRMEGARRIAAAGSREIERLGATPSPGNPGGFQYLPLRMEGGLSIGRVSFDQEDFGGQCHRTSRPVGVLASRDALPGTADLVAAIGQRPLSISDPSEPIGH